MSILQHIQGLVAPAMGAINQDLALAQTFIATVADTAASFLSNISSLVMFPAEADTPARFANPFFGEDATLHQAIKTAAVDTISVVTFTQWTLIGHGRIQANAVKYVAQFLFNVDFRNGVVPSAAFIESMKRVVIFRISEEEMVNGAALRKITKMTPEPCNVAGFRPFRVSSADLANHSWLIVTSQPLIVALNAVHEQALQQQLAHPAPAPLGAPPAPAHAGGVAGAGDNVLLRTIGPLVESLAHVATAFAAHTSTAATLAKETIAIKNGQSGNHLSVCGGGGYDRSFWSP